MLKEDGKSLEMTKIKAIIIGCGKIAGLYDSTDEKHIYSHANAYNSNSIFNLISCCDINLNNAKNLAIQYNVPNYSSNYISEINKHKPDVISICTPSKTHYSITKEILQHDFSPKIIFLEKPAVQNNRELQFIKKRSIEKNVKIVINHTRRFDPKHQQIKSMIEENKFGDLIRGDIYYYSGWKHNGVHVVDTLSYLFSDELQITRLIDTIEGPDTDDPTFEFEMRFKRNGSKIYIHGFQEKNYQLFEFDLKFKNARLRIEDFGQRILFETKVINNMYENVLIMDKISFKTENLSPMQVAVQRIADCINNTDNLDDILINDIAGTMKLIWEGSQWKRN